MSTISKPLNTYESIADVAAEAAQKGPTFKPGSGFQYSDAGADTLGAVVEAVTGKVIHEVVTERILAPLGMNGAITLLDPKHPSAAS